MRKTKTSIAALRKALHDVFPDVPKCSTVGEDCPESDDVVPLPPRRRRVSAKQLRAAMASFPPIPKCPTC